MISKVETEDDVLNYNTFQGLILGEYRVYLCKLIQKYQVQSPYIRKQLSLKSMDSLKYQVAHLSHKEAFIMASKISRDLNK